MTITLHWITAPVALIVLVWIACFIDMGRDSDSLPTDYRFPNLGRALFAIAYALISTVVVLIGSLIYAVLK